MSTYIGAIGQYEILAAAVEQGHRRHQAGRSQEGGRETRGRTSTFSQPVTIY